MTDSPRTEVSAHHRSARAATAAAFGLQGFLLAAILTQLPRYQDRFGDDTVIVVAVVTVSLVAGAGSVGAIAGALFVAATSALDVGVAAATSLRIGFVVPLLFAVALLLLAPRSPGPGPRPAIRAGPGS